MFAGSTRGQSEVKQVMFSDGIRPGGDLTELDGVSDSRIPPQQSAGGARRTKRVERSSQWTNWEHFRIIESLITGGLITRDLITGNLITGGLITGGLVTRGLIT